MQNNHQDLISQIAGKFGQVLPCSPAGLKTLPKVGPYRWNNDLALARGMRSEWPAEELAAIAAGRLLVVSPFEASVKRASLATAGVRNRMMVEMAERVVVGWCSEGGELERLLNQVQSKEVNLL